jgi:hypothetical protein
MKRKQLRRHNPVARAIRSGKVARPSTHAAAKGGAYRRHSKHKRVVEGTA